MKRREFIILLGGGALAGSIGPTQKMRVSRVGIIPCSIPVFARSTYPSTHALVQGLHALGYVEGKNLVLQWRSAETQYERIPEIVRELVSNKVDIVGSDHQPSCPGGQGCHRDDADSHGLTPRSGRD